MRTRHVLRYVITKKRAQIEIKTFTPPDTLAVRHLSSSFAFSFCKIQLSYLQIISKHTRNSTGAATERGMIPNLFHLRHSRYPFVFLVCGLGPFDVSPKDAYHTTTRVVLR